jgi:hypothetical protein
MVGDHMGILGVEVFVFWSSIESGDLGLGTEKGLKMVDHHAKCHQGQIVT